MFHSLSDICNNTKGRRDKVIVCRTAKQQGHTKLVWKADVECGGKDGCEWQRGEQMCSDKGF